MNGPLTEAMRKLPSSYLFLQENHRMSPSSPQSAIKVSDINTSNEFERVYSEAREYVEHVYSLIGLFFDRCQIPELEQSHRNIDSHISRLALFSNQSNDEFNVCEMVKALRVVQSRIEDKLISYFQNLEERDRMKVVFSLPQLRDHSYISVVNRSVHCSGNHLGNGMSFNGSIYQSANRSLSPNTSHNKRASNMFSHVRMSSPNKDEASVPNFNPPLDPNGTFSNSLEANQNFIGQMPIQNNRLDSIHKSAIESPEFFIPNLENNLNNNGQTNNLGSRIECPNIPNVGENQVISIPTTVRENLGKSSPNVWANQVIGIPTTVRENLGKSSPNVGANQFISIPTTVRENLGKSSPHEGAQLDISSLNAGTEQVRITPNVGEIPIPKAPYDGGNVDCRSKVNASQDPNMGNNINSNLSQSNLYNNRVSSKYLASFNIFLKRKNDLELEVNSLLASAENDQTQPSTLKLRGNDLKSKLASLKIDKWIEDDRF